MKRILIGVVLVVLLGLAGYVGMVIGRVAEDTPLAPSATIGTIEPSTGSILVLPTVGQESALDPTRQIILNSFLSGEAPTPYPECNVQTIDLSGDKQVRIVIEKPSSLWFAHAQVSDEIGGAQIQEVVTLNGTTFDNGLNLQPYYLYSETLSSVEERHLYDIPPGVYTLRYYMWRIRSSSEAEYYIYICATD